MTVTSNYLIFLPTILFLSVIIILVLTFSYKRARKLRNVLENIAIKRNGKLSNPWGKFGFPRLEFGYNSNLLKIYSVPGGRYSPPLTFIEVNLTFNTNQHMELYKEGFTSKVDKKLGAQDIEIGLDSFDKDIMIKGSDELFVRNILTYEIQDFVLKIVKNYNTKIRLDYDKLEVYAKKIIYEEYIYEELINTALMITDRIERRR